MRNLISVAFAVTLVTLGCSNSGENTPAPPAPPAAPLAPAALAAPPPAPSAAPSAAPAAQKVEILIGSVGNAMAFDKTKLTVPTGAEVHVTFKSNSTQDVLMHNWVLVNPGKEAAVAAQGLAKASTAGYVVPGPDVLAYTTMATPGGTAEATFTAPAPGNYPYICTFPGHYIMMKGVLTVTP